MKKQLKGSMTIEGSFIFPLLIIICIFIIFYTFRLHDKIVLKAHSYRILLNQYSSSDLKSDSSDIKEHLDSFRLLKNSYNLNYDQNNNTISINDSFNPAMNISFSSYERCTFIRKYHLLIKLME